MTPSRPRAARYIHFPGSVNAASLVEDKRRSAKQARLAHARELGTPTVRPKGWQDPAAAGSGSGSGPAPGGAGGCAEASGSEGTGEDEPMDSSDRRQPGGGSDAGLTSAARPMQAEPSVKAQRGLPEGAAQAMAQAPGAAAAHRRQGEAAEAAKSAVSKPA